MYTDTSALKLGERKDAPHYPINIPMNFEELRDWWETEKMEKREKRLLIFAPDIEPWSDMIDWRNTFHAVSHAGPGIDADSYIESCIWLLAGAI